LSARGYQVVASIPQDFRALFLGHGVTWVEPEIRAISRTVATATGKPLFLWVHQMDPHIGHAPGLVSEVTKSLGHHHLATARQEYERGVVKADAYVAALLAWQKGRGRGEETITVITADHGEEFGEHGGLGHGRSLYEEVVRIPLVIDTPAPLGRIIDVEVGMVDVAPTVRALLGMPSPPGTDGSSLVPYLEGQRPLHPPVFMEAYMTAHVLAVVRGGWKLIWTPDDNRTQLYDVREAKRTNVADREPERTAAMSSLLDLCMQGGCGVMSEAVARADVVLAGH
jgi:arylsulfatase A-like enzyme